MLEIEIQNSIYMDKFIKIDKKNELENIGGCSLNEQDNNLDIG